ncbi:nicotinamidase and pyrazinamidase [Klebsiella pneumoniae]|uniref:nicotinamidase n=1 Tax=Klebsiella pneumoniae TaxID=573 RepID=A0A2X3GTG5_KLEPN|nr:nicotinamidase and pyrazinamidase [Klebsiella pneumoniae]
MAHRALLLVDLQNDFCAGGALAVPEGDSTVDVANALIDWSLARGEPIVASQDWHPADHGSFASQHQVEPYTEGELDGLAQTFWPDHCVQHSEGRGAASAAQAAGDRRCVPQRAKPDHRQL